MKQSPILFSAPMVCAILDGTKTQTRRIMNPQPDGWIRSSDGMFATWGVPKKLTTKKPSKNGSIWQEEDGACYEDINCPYGNEGDLLWVKETFYAFGKWHFDSKSNKWSFIDRTLHLGFQYGYEAGTDNKLIQKPGRTELGWHKRPSIFMPRCASRMLLRIDRVWCERLNDIPEEDAISEGVFCYGEPRPGVFSYQNYDVLPGDDIGVLSAKKSYQSLWNKINGPDSWSSNPYVWVIKFKKTSE